MGDILGSVLSIGAERSPDCHTDLEKGIWVKSQKVGKRGSTCNVVSILLAAF